MSNTPKSVIKVFNLKAVLFVCFVLVSVVPVGSLTFWFQRQALEQERARVYDSHLLVAKNLTFALDRYALDVKAAATTVAGLLNNGASDAIVNSLVNPLLLLLNFNQLLLLDANNQVLAAVRPPNQSPRHWPQGYADLRQMATSELEFLPVTIGSDGLPGMWLLQRDADGRLLVAVINTQYFQSLQSAVTFGESGHAEMVDQAGTVIAHPRKDWVEQTQSLADLAPVVAMMKGDEGVLEYHLAATDTDMIAGYATVASTGWGVLVPQPISELRAAAEQSSAIAAIVGLLGMLGGGMLAWLLSGWITRPIRRLMEAAQSWSGGRKPNWDKAPRFLPLEFDQLNAAFETMSLRINHAHTELKSLAEKDGLTGLSNRTEIQSLLNTAIAALNKQGASKVGLLYIDLDRFKAINDSLGHAFGDAVLVGVAQRLQAVSGEAEIARLGGDEFLMVVQGFIDKQALYQKALEVVAVFGAPFIVGDQSVQIDCAIGIAIAPDDADSAAICLRQADVAMYHAKNDREEHVCFYAPFMQQEINRRQAIEQALRTALVEGGLELAYQPRVDLASGHAFAVEGLLRWPDFQSVENVSIDEIIVVAEHTGLINQLGNWVLTRAFDDLRDVLSSDGTPLIVSLNLSPTQFASPKLVESLMAATLSADFSPSRLEVEITETTAMSDVEQACQVLDELARYGVTSSIDDFGTGYSSLSYLKRLPVGFIKIDRSFIEHVEKNADDQAIVRTILSLCSILDIPAVAEGVETKAQLEFLAAEGCDQVQGYWFAKPMPVAELTDWMENRGKILNADGLRDGQHLEESCLLPPFSE